MSEPTTIIQKFEITIELHDDPWEPETLKDVINDYLIGDHATSIISIKEIA